MCPPLSPRPEVAIRAPFRAHLTADVIVQRAEYVELAVGLEWEGQRGAGPRDVKIKADCWRNMSWTDQRGGGVQSRSFDARSKYQWVRISISF